MHSTQVCAKVIVYCVVFALLLTQGSSYPTSKVASQLKGNSSKDSIKKFKIDFCGQRKAKAPRIIMGVDSYKGEWPWQVAIHFYDQTHCGGVLIDPQNVLTAAHCVEGFSPTFFKVLLGSLEAHNNKFSGRNIQYIQVDSYTMHRQFGRLRMSNDIAILHLEKPVYMSSDVQTICLPLHRQKPKAGQKCIVTGWGTTNPSNGATKNVLQKTSLTIMDDTACISKNLNAGPGLGKSMFCGASRNPQLLASSACHGDSGGPLSCQRPDGSWEVTGIVSWGSKVCDTKDAYTVFTTVSDFIPWIENSLKHPKKVVSTK